MAKDDVRAASPWSVQMSNQTHESSNPGEDNQDTGNSVDPPESSRVELLPEKRGNVADSQKPQA